VCIGRVDRQDSWRKADEVIYGRDFAAAGVVHARQSLIGSCWNGMVRGPGLGLGQGVRAVLRTAMAAAFAQYCGPPCLLRSRPPRRSRHLDRRRPLAAGQHHFARRHPEMRATVPNRRCGSRERCIVPATARAGSVRTVERPQWRASIRPIVETLAARLGAELPTRGPSVLPRSLARPPGGESDHARGFPCRLRSHPRPPERGFDRRSPFHGIVGTSASPASPQSAPVVRARRLH
jgi:hypothetical protein